MFRKLMEKHQNEKGFTLIELMIVIAIIGILAAIAIPNYLRYRGNAACSAIESDVQNYATALAGHLSESVTNTVAGFPAVDTANTDLTVNATGTVITGAPVANSPCAGIHASNLYTLTMGQSGSW